MIRTVILDDEDHAIRSLSSLLLENNDVDIVFKSTDADAAINFMLKNEVDLIFLDIKMPGQTGFDVLDKLNKLGVNSFEVVFLTAYDEFAIKAIKYAAFDYLLKPIDKIELQDTINKFLAKKDSPKPYSFQQLLNLLQTETKIKISTNTGYEYLNANDIAYAESDSNYTKLVLTNNETRLVSKTLKDIEDELTSCSFIRTHKSFLINKKYLTIFNRKDSNCTLICNSNNFIVPVSSRMAKNLSELSN